MDWTDLGRISLRAARKGRFELLADAIRRGGDYATVRVGGLVRLYLLHDPAGIRHVLVANQRNYERGEPEKSPLMRALGPGLLLADGEFHLRQRRLINPTFAPKRIAEYAHTAVHYVERTRQEWERATGQVVDMNEEMMHLTMLAIGKVLFDVDLSSDSSTLRRAITEVNQLTSELGFSLVGRLPWLPTPANLRLSRRVREVDRVVYGLIDERRQSGLDKGDLLSLLLAARDEESDDPAADRMTDEQVRNEALILFAAGHETTANMLTWTWYLLAQNPEVEATLHGELDRVLGGRAATFEDLPALPYTEQVLRESLRLYPVAWINGRKALQPDVIEGRELPAGSIVLMSTYYVQRDARWFPDPERFDPERFAPNTPTTRPRFAYFPFGGGVRQCIGQSFAEMEGRLTLASLAQHFTPRLLPGHRVVPEAMITLRPKGGLPMRLVPRAS